MEVIDGVGANTNAPTNANASVCPPEASPPHETMRASSLNPTGGLSPHHHHADRARFAGVPERSDAQGIEMAALAESEAE